MVEWVAAVEVEWDEEVPLDVVEAEVEMVCLQMSLVGLEDSSKAHHPPMGRDPRERREVRATTTLMLVSSFASAQCNLCEDLLKL